MNQIDEKITGVNLFQQKDSVKILQIDSLVKEKDTASSKREYVPTEVEIKQYYSRLRERKLLIGDSKYIKPRNDFYIEHPSKTETTGFAFPEYAVKHTNYDWFVFLIFAALLLFALVKTLWNKYLINLFRSVINHSASVRVFDGMNTSDMQGAFFLDLQFYMIFSAFTYQVLAFFIPELPVYSFTLYLLLVALVLAMFVLKKLTYSFLGFVTEKISETKEYLFNMKNFRRVAGVVLLPFVTLIAFNPFSGTEILVFGGMAVALIIYFLLIIRVFVILMNKQFPKFYLFLYFCTLEVLPLVLLYKVLVEEHISLT